MIMEGGGHVFITYHALLLYSHLHFMVSALAPKLSRLLQNGTIYHLQSLLRPDLQVCLRIAPDATASGFIVVLLPTLSLLL